MTKWILTCFFLIGSSAFAAPKTADRMTCNQAIKYYETHKRIYVVANGGDVVPVYGMKPAKDWRTVTCSGRGQNMWYYTVKTLDNRKCPIAVYCQ